MDNTARDKTLAVFTLIDRNGEEAGVLTASLPELGFDPEARDDSCASLALPEHYCLPRHIAVALRNWVAEDEGGSGQPVWLRMSVPLGLLAAVPWEELLQPLLGVPLLRLPYQSICPRQPPASNTAICFSSPVEEPGLQARLDEFMREVPIDLARATRFHLFGDHVSYPALCRLQEAHAETIRIEVYDPVNAPPAGSAPNGNPWLRWIVDAMGQGKVDVVHFLCHSDHHADAGALKMASQPSDKQDGRHPCLACAAELIEFLDHVGAWCVAFTSAPAERSAAGMRMLQTEVARMRPGPVLVHDMNVPGSADALGMAYRFLFNGNRVPPASPAVALYCHPILASERDVDEESARQLDQFTLEGRLGAALHDDSLPGCILSSQRKLEVSAGELSDALALGPDSGRVRARHLVLDAVSEYLRTISDQSGSASSGGKHE
jgi:hypothetical protein